MLPTAKGGFELDGELERASFPVVWLGLCELRLQNDSRWPWAILIPQRQGIEEFHDLSPLDQAMLTFEMNLVSKSLQTVTRCHKMNIAALGNVVRQLHVHIVARWENDANWPGPVWGHGFAVPYRREDLHSIAGRLRSELLKAGI